MFSPARGILAALALLPLHAALAADFAGPEPARFQVTTPVQGTGEQAGEPTIGFNPKTNRAMFIAGVETLRVTFPENLVEKLPESCDAVWENKSAVNTTTISFDPILFTDRQTGRTFVSQLLIAAGESAFAYTDDDGETWTPSPATLSGGIDHQAVGGGPYKTLPGLPTYGNSVFYCSQSLVESFCIRSDDGGLSFGPPMPLSGVTGCSAIHGHVFVAPDGTAYVPVPNCNGEQGLKVSENDGLSWASRNVTGSSGRGSNNPALGIASDGSLYYCYQDFEGRIHATVSRDKGLSWENDTDLGAAIGLESGVFPVAAAGDPDRAACGFLGTKTVGNSTAMDFEGVWHPYVAVTYDGGKSWSISNVSPDDPVQGAGGIHEGGAGPISRNLLDFNDMDLDQYGRVLMGYADGCIGGCRYNPAFNSYSARATIARQTGGRSLFAEFDKPGSGKPAASCMTSDSARDSNTALLKWRAPDNGGSDITGYKIFRGSSPDSLKQVAETGPALAYADATAAAAPSETYYRITAVNAKGDGESSNLLNLPVSTIPVPESACAAPGLTLIKDPVNDARTKNSAHDVQQVNAAEPSDQPGKLVITMKIGQTPALPPASLYETRMVINSDLSFFAGMETTEGSPRFVYGTIGVTTLVATTASEYSVLGELADGSGYDPATGTITLVLEKSALAEFFDTSPGSGMVMAAFARALTPDPANLAATSFDPTGNAAYFFRQNDCSSLSDGKQVTATSGPARFGGALGLGMLLPLLLGLGRRR